MPEAEQIQLQNREQVLLRSVQQRLAEAMQLLQESEDGFDSAMIASLINCAALAIADQLANLES